MLGANMKTVSLEQSILAAALVAGLPARRQSYWSAIQRLTLKLVENQLWPRRPVPRNRSSALRKSTFEPFLV